MVICHMLSTEWCQGNESRVQAPNEFKQDEKMSTGNRISLKHFDDFSIQDSRQKSDDGATWAHDIGGLGVPGSQPVSAKN